MPKLNAIVALVSGKKTRSNKAVTEVYQKVQKGTLFEGMRRDYTPLKEDGEDFPPESKAILMRTSDAVDTVRAQLTDLFDAVATLDAGNCDAKADVVVDGKTILSDVPITHLLFLEKQLVDVATFVGSLPVLDPAHQWTYSKDVDCFVSELSRTKKTKRVMKNHVKAEATDKHPAQVDVYNEDETIGTWNTVNYSAAIPAREKKDIQKRVEKIQDAVKLAREQANLADVQPVKVGDAIFSYIFGS